MIATAFGDERRGHQPRQVRQRQRALARREDSTASSITPSGVALRADGARATSCAMTLQWRAHGASRCRHRSGASTATFTRARLTPRAIVHTHAPFATTLACLHRGIPPFHYMVAVAGGGDMRCADRTRRSARRNSPIRRIEALAGADACLLANHGMIAIGPSLEQALALAVEVETLAEMYWRALQIGNRCNSRTDEMDVVLKNSGPTDRRDGPRSPRHACRSCSLPGSQPSKAGVGNFTITPFIAVIQA